MLLKGPERKESYAAKLGYTTSARNAWGEILRRIAERKGAPLNLLVPAYIGQNDREGSGVFDPIRASGASVDFYPLDGSLIPNVAAIESALAAGDVDVLLIIHYFGFVTVDLRALSALCKRHGVILVEDCAHCCFLPSSHYGFSGDYSFYSLHKFFPTETGGVLRVNGEDETAAGDYAECDRSVLEQLLRTDIRGLNQKRRDNYAYLEQALTGAEGVQPLWRLDDETVPHNFPVRIADDRREKLYFYLQEHDLVTIALYYRMVDELDREKFPESFAVSSSILNLPVHQDTDEPELAILVDRIEQFFKS